MASKYVDISSSRFFRSGFLMGMACVLHGCSPPTSSVVPVCDAEQSKEYKSAEESCLKEINVTSGASCEDTAKAMRGCESTIQAKLGCGILYDFDDVMEIRREIWKKLPDTKTSAQTEFKACLEAAKFEGKDCDTYGEKYFNCRHSVQAARSCPPYWMDEVANTTIPDQTTWYLETCSDVLP